MILIKSADMARKKKVKENKAEAPEILEKEKEGADKKDTIIQELEDQVQELQDKYLRLFAEFDNYKKRMVKERLEMIDQAGQNTISQLLPILDDFDRAKQSADDDSTDESFSEGISLVYNKLHNTLKTMGLNPMETTGEMFDPEFHEAMTEIPAQDPEQKGRIIDTIEKGYTLKDRIIRYAKVVVGS